MVPYAEVEVARLGGPDDLERAPAATLARLVERVVSVEGPVHEDELLRRVLAHWDLTRAGRKARQLIDAAVKGLLDAERARRRGDFLWPVAIDPARPPVRDRTSAGPREADRIPQEEMRSVLRLVLAKEFRVPREALLLRSAKLLGFARAGSTKLGVALERTLDDLVREGALAEADGVIALGSGPPAT